MCMCLCDYFTLSSPYKFMTLFYHLVHARLLTVPPQCNDGPLFCIWSILIREFEFIACIWLWKFACESSCYHFKVHIIVFIYSLIILRHAAMWYYLWWPNVVIQTNLFTSHHCLEGTMFFFNFLVSLILKAKHEWTLEFLLYRFRQKRHGVASRSCSELPFLLISSLPSFR